MTSPTPNPSATTTTEASAPTRVFATYIRATRELIWRALTESDFTTRYWYGSSVHSDWQAGSRYEIRTGGALAIEGEIIEAEPPRRLAMTFHDAWSNRVPGDQPARVTFEIDDAGPGVSKLTVIHEDVAGHDSRIAEVSDGWPFILAGLKTLLETGQPLSSKG